MAKKCMKCGGAMKMAKGGSVKPFAAGIPYATGAGATDGKNGMMKKGGAVKKMQAGGTTTMPKVKARTAASIAKGIDKANTNTTAAQRLIKKYSSARDNANTNTTSGEKIKVMTSQMKKGGMVKNAKLAALAAPTNKVTRADIIVGAKRNAKKK